MFSLSACTLPALVCCLYGMCHVISLRVYFLFCMFMSVCIIKQVFVFSSFKCLHYQASSVCLIIDECLAMFA